MSRHVASLVYAKQVGSMARKAVLAYMADRANDDGSGIWTAKQRIADEVECSKQTVITTIKGLLADGIIIEAGQRQNRNGYTVEYNIVVAAVAALPDAKSAQEVQNDTGPDLDGSTSLTARGQAALPKPSCNRPSRKTTSSSKPASAGKIRFPDDWALPTIADLPPQAKACAEQWTEASYATHGEAFANFWRGEGRMKTDWRLTWANRIVALHSSVMRDQKFGNAPTGKPGVASVSEDEAKAFYARWGDRQADTPRPFDPPGQRDRNRTAKPIGQLIPFNRDAA